MSSPRPPPDELDHGRPAEAESLHLHDEPMITTESSENSIVPQPQPQHVGESSSTANMTNNGDNATSPPLPTPVPTSASTTPPNPSSSASPPAAPHGAAPGTASSPNRRRAPRPLSSVSFFLPFTGQRAGPDGPQVGLTWTLEVFGNDEEGGGGPAPDPGPEGTPNVEAAADTAAQAQNTPGPEAADPNAADGAGQGTNPPQTPQNQERDGPTRSIFFIVGPDGTMRRGDGAVDDTAPQLFPFPFPFAFPFQAGPPPPDPAKAAELLNSLPTVGRALLKRVDKVVAAEGQRDDGDSSGWQCGVCLEGIDVGETVKALPCNHLFHEACLQPWFTNHHHNCPTCRLDLDPLRTLHEPARRAPLRPTTTGSGRGTPAARAPHPYARPGAAGAANTEGRRSQPGSNAPTQPGTPQNERADGAGNDRLDVPMNPMDMALDIARMLGLPIGSPAPMREGEQLREEGDGDGERANQNQEEPAAVPSEPAENIAAEQPRSPPHDGLPRPTPQRRRHITVFHIGGDGGVHEETHMRQAAAGPDPQAEGAHVREGTPANAPETPDTAPAREDPPAWAPGLFGLNPLAGAAMDWGTFMTGGGVGANTPNNAGTPAAGEAPVNAETQAGTPPAGPAPPVGPAAPGPANARAGTPAPNREGAEGNAGTGTFRFPFEFMFVRPPPGGPPEEPVQPENQAPVPQSTFVPQTLESWTAQREKGLGWRCDAIECLIAPPVPDAELMDVDDDETENEADAGEKEMLAIYAENQAPFPPREKPEDEPHTGHEFVLLACPHRWHRACLETAARSAGHSTVPDASGREWIRCARCRKEGWIVPRETETVTLS
ncbi:hypothetical protein CspHIS471_0410170 [Cutaneotrichosporon sp. HIS471]|nr:hypothetical protein CspHIS471_0410170 [Cutaneotrichosporon sp. HIS471]